MSIGAPRLIVEGGLFIVHEGGEGAGKTTQAHALQEKLSALGYDVITTREPGATELGRQLRRIVLSPELAGAIVGAENLLLFAADQHAHVRKVIKPALQEGKIVISDRYIYSTFTYQSIEGVDLEAVRYISKLATQGLRPDRAYWFDVTPEIGLSRIETQKRSEQTKYDQAPLAFHNRVREEFSRQWKALPHEIKRIDADRSGVEVTEEVYADLLELLKTKSVHAAS